MRPLEKRIDTLQTEVASASERLLIDAKKSELDALEVQLAEPEIWNNPSYAQDVARQAKLLQSSIDPWTTLRQQVADIGELLAIGDETMVDEFDEQISAFEREFKRLKKDLLFTGEYDTRGAIVKLSAGAGGTDAQDWTEMLERMYLRWAEHTGFTTQLIDRSPGEEAGLKSVTYAFSGPYAYGKLKSEHGAHRLVRLSPFNSDNLRQTSFSLVEVLPEIDAPDDDSLDDKDLKIDVYRSGGKGGQSVNTTDSAVRITHVPTRTVVAIQNERSQLQNRETALKILRSRLTQMKLEQHADKLSDLRAGESASWGSQIRNYVLHPYTMVKDTRTKHENRDAQAVLNGKIDDFIEAYLEYETKEGA